MGSQSKAKYRSMDHEWTLRINSSILSFLFSWYLSLAEKSLFSGAVIQSIVLHHTVNIFRVFADLCSLKLDSLG